MKNLTCILLLLFALPLTGIAQQNSIVANNEMPNFNNQIDLDVYFLGVEASYKRRVSPSLFLGFGLGTTMLRSTLSSDNSIVDNGFLEIIRVRPFLGFFISRNFHFEVGITGATTISFIVDNNGYSMGLEVGAFLRVRKINIGLRPSVLYFKDEGSNNFSPAILTSPLIVIKIPLKRW